MKLSHAAVFCLLSALGLAVVLANDPLLESLANARAAWKDPKAALEACRDEGGLTDAMVMDVANRSFTEVTPKGKCFLACTAEKLEFMVDNKMATDNILLFARVLFAHEPAKSARRIQLTEAAVKECEAEVGARALERCELAASMRTCFFKSDTKIFSA